MTYSADGGRDGTDGDAPHRVRLDAGTDAVDVRIVTAVAEFTGLDPLELPPLHSAVDPDAVNDLFDPSKGRLSEGRLTFEYAGVEVTIATDGDIRLRSTD